MKKILPLAICLLLGGCTSAQWSNFQSALSFGAVGTTNPVTKTTLSQVEAAETVLFVALNSWKTSCTKGLINTNCKDQIAAVQVYTRQIPPYQAQLRTFVKNNDQVNAGAIYTTIMGLINASKQTAAASGVALGGTS